MKNHIDTIAKLTNYIKKSLAGLYPDSEINQLVFLILNHLQNYSKIDIHLNAERPISQNIFQQTQAIISQLSDYKPIQYILGVTEFYGLPIKVNSNVLIPRQETEELVRWVIDDNKKRKIRILDIGTGSGCIAIAVANAISNAIIDALDSTEKVLQLAAENAHINEVSVRFFRFDMLKKKKFPYSEKYDVMVSNPPYILNSEKKFMNKNVLEYEPHMALFVSDDNPLIFYDRIAEFGLNHLKSEGKIYLEINENYGIEVKELFLKHGYPLVELRRDIHGKNRMVKITFVV